MNVSPETLRTEANQSFMGVWFLPAIMTVTDTLHSVHSTSHTLEHTSGFPATAMGPVNTLEKDAEARKRKKKRKKSPNQSDRSLTNLLYEVHLLQTGFSPGVAALLGISGVSTVAQQAPNRTPAHVHTDYLTWVHVVLAEDCRISKWETGLRWNLLSPISQDVVC